MQWNYIRANFARQIFEQQQILRSAIVIRNGPYFSLSHSPSEFLVRRGRATPFACRRKTRPLSESYQFVADLILVWNWYIGLKWSEPYQWCSLSLAASFRVWLSVSAECECMWNYATVALACVYTICTSNAIWPANFLMAYFAYRFKSNLEIENCIRNSLLLLLCECICAGVCYIVLLLCVRSHVAVIFVNFRATIWFSGQFSCSSHYSLERFIIIAHPVECWFIHKPFFDNTIFSLFLRLCVCDFLIYRSL